MTLYPGSWCDVVAHPSGYAFVYQSGQSIVCAVNGATVWQVYLSEPVLYLRAACAPDGTVRAIGQGNQTGFAWVIGADGATSLGFTFGQNCTVLTWEDGFVAYIQRTGATFTRWPLNAPEPAAQPISIGPTSQGWLDVHDGVMVWTDTNRTKIVEGYTLHLPVWRDGVTAGQGSVLPDQITAVLPNGQASTVIEATSWEPHIAALADGRNAICARTPQGAALAICPPWPAFVRALPPELPPVPVPPTPTPGPEPMKLHRDVMAVIRAYASVIPIPRGAAGEIDDQCREWTKGLCETAKALFPGGFPGLGGEFGWKRASGTRPLSKETIALKVGAALHGWDLLIGVGTGRPKLSDDPAYHDLVAEGNQVFVPVEAIDRLVPAPASGHAPLDVPMWGISAFDLGCRIQEGDTRYLDEIVVPSGLTPRIVVASVYRTPRTQAAGRAQMAGLFDALKARGLRCVVTLLTDTDKHRTTRAEALDHVREMNRGLLAWPDVIRAVRIGNENSHSVEADYMVDPDFLRDAAALIDRRFPLSFGAGHGGEPVLSGGSFASHHSNRGESPETNAAMMAEAQRVLRVQVVDEEPLGIAEPDRVAGRQRTADPEWARRQAQSAKDQALGGSTFHCDAGISCQMAEWGPTQAAALAAFVAVVGGLVVPVPIGDPLETLKAAAIESAIVVAYRDLLGRKPDDFGRLFYGDRLRDGRMTVASMEADIKASAEYEQRHGGTA